MLLKLRHFIFNASMCLSFSSSEFCQLFSFLYCILYMGLLSVLEVSLFCGASAQTLDVVILTTIPTGFLYAEHCVSWYELLQYMHIVAFCLVG